MQLLVGDLLESAGYQVTHANDGAQAVETYRTQRPDVVLMDIILPQVDGIHAISRIQDIDPDAQIVVVTGLSDEAVKHQAMGAGATDFVAKPFGPEQLLAAVQSALARRAPVAHELQVLS